MNNLIFEIPLPDGRTVFMDGSPEYGTIVWVNSQKFYEIIWDFYKNDTKHTAKKMPGVEDCFLHSADKPIELPDGAYMFFDQDKKVFKFQDGCTRSFWLIQNGVHMFPVFTSPELAEELASVTNGKVHS